MAEIETRRIRSVAEIADRAHEGRAATGRTIRGYAARFFAPADPEGTQVRLGSMTIERIARTAFDRTLREHFDVRSFFDHESTLILGRIGNGTLRLKVDGLGLFYEVDLPATSAGDDVLELVRRGDVAGASFQFLARVERRLGEDPYSGGRMIRELLDVDLFEVGPVAIPAYEATTVSASLAPRSAEGGDSPEDPAALCHARDRNLDLLARKGGFLPPPSAAVLDHHGRLLELNRKRMGWTA